MAVFIELLFSLIFDKTDIKTTYTLCCNSDDYNNNTDSKCSFVSEEYECESFDYFQVKIDNYLNVFYQLTAALSFVYTIFSVYIFNCFII